MKRRFLAWGVSVLAATSVIAQQQPKPRTATRYLTFNVVGCAGGDVYTLASDWLVEVKAGASAAHERQVTWLITAKLPHAPMQQIHCDDTKSERVYLRVVYDIATGKYPPTDGALYFADEQIHVRSSMLVGHDHHATP